MNVRHQVFLSGTFRDLTAEREAAIRALMKIDCIPAGMEWFPASSETQWELIQRIIDQCDYFVVIVAGRYGSVDASGISYTEREFDYAISKGMPTIGLVHQDIGKLVGDKLDLDADSQRKLKAFRSKVEDGRTVDYWSDPSDLALKCMAAVVNERQTTPRPGWIRSSDVPVGVIDAFQALQAETERLRVEVERLTSAPLIPDLAPLEAAAPIAITIQHHTGVRQSAVMPKTWIAVFQQVGPMLMEDPEERSIKARLERDFKKEKGLNDMTGISIAESSMETLRLQFQALNLVKVAKAQSGRLKWSLTPAGQCLLLESRTHRVPARESLAPAHTPLSGTGS